MPDIPPCKCCAPHQGFDTHMGGPIAQIDQMSRIPRIKNMELSHSKTMRINLRDDAFGCSYHNGHYTPPPPPPLSHWKPAPPAICMHRTPPQRPPPRHMTLCPPPPPPRFMHSEDCTLALPQFGHIQPESPPTTSNHTSLAPLEACNHYLEELPHRQQLISYPACGGMLNDDNPNDCVVM
ncbi:hypothetical protein Acr_23g0004290 [Actinidia rufa]|uniref:Uncharacterized protein n=1 Tax=Actinidia rufa TaxID=165716 RepID=A0A7J0GMY6_9ERIC|nr:hypothetical protein Acr_23g0004290 [Actinidia rufa]